MAQASQSRAGHRPAAPQRRFRTARRTSWPPPCLPATWSCSAAPAAARPPCSKRPCTGCSPGRGGRPACSPPAGRPPWPPPNGCSPPSRPPPAGRSAASPGTPSPAAWSPATPTSSTTAASRAPSAAQSSGPWCAPCSSSTPPRSTGASWPPWSTPARSPTSWPSSCSPASAASSTPTSCSRAPGPRTARAGRTRRPSSPSTTTTSPSRTRSTRPASSSRPATCSRTGPRCSPPPWPRAVLAGDPAGATDAFRGASPGALPAFAERLGASVVLLERSRRLGGPGLDAVRRLQAAGTGPAVALAGGGTTTVEAARYPGPAEEAEAVARLLRVAHERDGVPYGRMAVLLPSTRRLGGPVRRALERFGVPYRLGAGERQLVAEPVVGHVLDLFRLALDPTRADELLPPLLTSPLGGLDPGELRALRRAAVLADRSLAEHVRDPDGAAADPDGAAADPDDAAADPDDGEGADTPPGEPEGGPRPAAPVTPDPTLRPRVAALCELLGQAEGWVAELDADACFWEVWRHAPAFAELVTRAEADPSDADVQRQLDALTAFSRALGLFVDGRPGASMRTYLDVVERADFTGDPWLPPAVAGSDAVALLS